MVGDTEQDSGVKKLRAAECARSPFSLTSPTRYYNFSPTILADPIDPDFSKGGLSP
jgi:hypothetical protein